MIRIAIIAFSMLALCATMPSAQEKRESGISSWFKELQKKIDIISPRKSLSVSTGVAGVRGARDDSSRSKLYWKGKKGDEAVTEAELAEFKEGLAFIEAGKRTEATHEFEEFMMQYPDSALIPDAKKTLDIMKMEAKAEPAAEAKAEPKADRQPEVKAEAKPEPKEEGR
jgi:TolA-binding protein